MSVSSDQKETKGDRAAAVPLVIIHYDLRIITGS